jgi:riboflavin synthase
MFSGIIEKQARILSMKKEGSILGVRVASPKGWKLKDGQSVSIDGICSTIVAHRAASFDVEYMPETLSKTTAATFSKGRMVNLERSLVYGQRIDGHLVQGHVDMALPVRDVRVLGKSREITFKPKAAVARAIALHGSIAVNGVSLTVAKKHGPNFTVALIPHTLAHTNLANLAVGDFVNIELDHSPKYLAAMRTG